MSKTDLMNQRIDELEELRSHLSAAENRRLDAIIERVESGQPHPRDCAALHHMKTWVDSRLQSGDQPPEPNHEHLAALQRLVDGINARHPGLGLAAARFDILDVRPGILEGLLAMLDESAEGSGFGELAKEIATLRLDDLPLTLEDFERLVSWGRIPGVVRN
jgi:hypothetical protein